MNELQNEIAWTKRVLKITEKAKRDSYVARGPKWVGIRFDDLITSLRGNIRELGLEAKTMKK